MVFSIRVTKIELFIFSKLSILFSPSHLLFLLADDIMLILACTVRYATPYSHFTFTLSKPIDKGSSVLHYYYPPFNNKIA